LPRQLPDIRTFRRVGAKVNPPSICLPAWTYLIRRAGGQATRQTSIRADHKYIVIARLRAVERNPAAIRRPSRASGWRSIERGKLNRIASLAIAGPELRLA